jgi:hypothetical protein
MFTTDAFASYTQWSGIATLVMALLAGIAFKAQWGLRFRMVGATGFMGVLTVGLFALSLVPLTHVEIPGAVRYSLVFDTGSTQTVIAVPATITQDQLEATLQQASVDLFSPGRLGRQDNQLTIRARTILHPKPGISEPVFLGQVKRSLALREDPNQEITIFSKNLARLPQVES